MSQRPLLIGGALAVAALVGGLIYALRSGEPAATPREAPPVAARPAAPDRPTSGTPAPVGVRPVEPGRAVPLPPVELVNDAGVTVVKVEGRPGPGSPIAAATIADTRQVIEPAVRACMRDVQLAAPGRIVVHATLKVGGNRVSTSNVSLSGDGILPIEARECIIKAYQEFQTDTLPDQPDGEDVVHMPWTVP